MPHTIPLRVRQGVGILLLLQQSAHVGHRMSPHVAELGSLLAPSNFAAFIKVSKTLKGREIGLAHLLFNVPSEGRPAWSPTLFSRRERVVPAQTRPRLNSRWSS